MSNITLTAGVRQNLLSLQQTADLMSQTQNCLATGKKVNSALDNPLNFFTSSSLSARASDLSNLLDSMSNGIQTIQAANNGLTAMTSLVQQLQATVSQARGDLTAAAITPGSYTTTGGNTSTETNNKLTLDLGGGVNVSVDTYTHTNATVSTVTGTGGVFSADLSAAAFSINDGNGADAITFQAGSVTEAAKIADINTSFQAAGSTVSAEDHNGQIRLVNSTGKTITVTADAASAADTGIATGTVSTDGSVEVNQVKTIDQLVSEINGSSVLSGQVKASNVSGQLKLENLTNTDFTLTGASATAITGATANTTTLAGGVGAALSSVRQSLLTQFNSLLTQLDQAATDSGYNGINLLNGDSLKLDFNADGSSSITVQAKDFERQCVHRQQHQSWTVDGDERPVREQQSARHPEHVPERCAHHAPYPGLLARLAAVGGADPSGLHQEHDQHPADRLGQPGARRYQRGKRQPAVLANSPAALDHRAVAVFAGQPGGAPSVRLIASQNLKEETAGPCPAVLLLGGRAGER